MGQPGFSDLDERYQLLSENGDPLVKLTALIDFEAFRPMLATALKPSDGSKGGRPPERPAQSSLGHRNEGYPGAVHAAVLVAPDHVVGEPPEVRCSDLIKTEWDRMAMNSAGVIFSNLNGCCQCVSASMQIG